MTWRLSAGNLRGWCWYGGWMLRITNWIDDDYQQGGWWCCYGRLPSLNHYFECNHVLIFSLWLGPLGEWTTCHGSVAKPVTVCCFRSVYFWKNPGLKLGIQFSPAAWAGESTTVICPSNTSLIDTGCWWWTGGWNWLLILPRKLEYDWVSTVFNNSCQGQSTIPDCEQQTQKVFMIKGIHAHVWITRANNVYVIYVYAN